MMRIAWRHLARYSFTAAAAVYCSAAATVWGATPAVRIGTDAFVPVDCYVFRLTVSEKAAQCGYVSVPLRHADKDSPRIKLAVTVLPAADPDQRKPDPLFLAQGGPGGSTISSFAQVLIDDESKRPVRNRDLVLWDQRGTYFSQPRLTCPETEDIAEDADDKTQLEAAHRCGVRLAAETGDLSAFNSVENARDVDSVRAALGYDAFNFYGVSYGSELGQFLIRERPLALRSVILDAVVPLGFSLVTDVPAVKQQVMQRYAQACKGSPACNTAYPDLDKRYLALLERLDRDPVPLFPAAANAPAAAPASAAAGATDKTAMLTGKMLDSALYQSVYQRESVSLVPYIVQRAEMGDYSFVVNFAQVMKSKRSDMAGGMYMTVVCSEYGDTPQEALRFPGVIKRFADAGQIEARQILDVCRDWNIRLLEKSLSAPVKSDLPTLLLSGRFDPITPPEGADRVAANLANSYRVTFASGTHGQAFVVPCANAIVTSFLDTPAIAPVDTCAKEASPVFWTPDQLLNLPATRRGGSATLQEQMLALAPPGIAIGLALFVLFSAVPIYSIAEVVRVFRHRPISTLEGWQGRLIAAAPWVPVLAGFLLLAFLIAVAISVGGAVSKNQMLLLVGAVPAWVKSLTWGLLPYIAALTLMTIAMVLLWRYRARSIVGRLYYTALVVTGWGMCIVLLRTGLLQH